MSQKEDLINKRFGMLTVIAPAESKNNRTRWMCRCDCGKEIVTLATSLKQGLTTSCGCSRVGKRRTNIKGKRFGRLTVLEYVGYSKTGNSTLWKCKCDCGNTIVASYMNLQTHHTTSCGCRLGEIWKDASKRVDGLKKSPKTGSFETNIHAKNYVIETKHDTFKIRNMSLFVRNNPELFGIKDKTDKKEVLNVVKNLSAIKDKGKEWHGFRVFSGEDKIVKK